jgi:hypothetical protein
MNGNNTTIKYSYNVAYLGPSWIFGCFFSCYLRDH